MNPKQQRRMMYGVQVLFIVYLYILVKIILFKFGTIDPVFLWHQLQQGPHNLISSLHTGNLIPLATLSDTYDHPTPHNLLNLTGNIALFIPYGLFLVLLSPHGKSSGSFTGVLLWSFALSAALEGSQALFYIGTFDVDDLLLNTIGGLLGYLLLRPVMQLCPSRSTEEKCNAHTQYQGP
ncbi:VanZ family protein [Paenibacillus sp. FSL K6-1096]|uniref:VanZ family protein n=1 Tax=Paenibacillus sp. FSL K6-1096 TaxID=2921460 RepID=UPI0030EC08C5